VRLFIFLFEDLTLLPDLPNFLRNVAYFRQQFCKKNENNMLKTTNLLRREGGFCGKNMQRGDVRTFQEENGVHCNARANMTLQNGVAIAASQSGSWAEQVILFLYFIKELRNSSAC
jgi:hypothetical protein